MNKEIMRKLDPEWVADFEKGKCPSCKRKIKKGKFRDDKSIREYKISGLCQKCQDRMFIAASDDDADELSEGDEDELDQDDDIGFGKEKGEEW